MATDRGTGLEDRTGDEDAVFFDEGLPDDQLVEALKKAIDESEAWWNSAEGFNLKEVRRRNVNLWLPKHLDDVEMYDYEEENAYIDPRIFLSVETIMSIAAGRLPRAEVYPASDSTTSYMLAREVQEGLGAWAEQHQLLDIMRSSLRTSMLKRIGLIKLEFDEHLGDDGDIKPVLVDPKDIIVDKNARKGENPRFIAHRQSKTVDEWVAKFPQSKKKIYAALGIKRGVVSQRAKREIMYETWFTWYDKSNKPQESVAWLLKDKVIAKMRHPHWIHEDEKMSDVDSNVLSYPEKPFFAINHLNLGLHWIDDTSLVEQAATLQKILEKRGRQLTQNADDSSGGLVLNAAMVDKTDAARLTGDPQEKIMVDGDVRQAAARIAPAQLPSYVLEDKYDARQEIDNVFAVHETTRGERSNSKTLGQDMIQQNQDMTRHDDLIRSVEFMATRLYRYVVQMMKVHYTEDHMFKMAGDAGKFTFITLKNDKIEDGIDIKVKAGSTLPMDKTSLRNQTLELTQAGMIDPLTLYETLQFPEPQKMVERLIKYQSDQAGFIKDFKEEDYERDAFANIQVINNGMDAQEVKEPSAEYLDYYRNYMMTGEFQDLPQEVQAAHIQHIEEVATRLQKLAELKATQQPTEEEINEANQKEVEMAGMQQEVMGGGGNPPAEALMQRQSQPEQPVV
jgi:hypothetical protein